MERCETGRQWALRQWLPTRSFRLGLLVVALWLGIRGSHAEDNDFAQGTIISVRGNILVLRPLWRPKPKRVAFDTRTEIALYEQAQRSALRPGQRINLGGRYNAGDGLMANWVEIVAPGVFKTQKMVGFSLNKAGTYANGQGIIKSLQPFVYTDDTGKEFKADLTKLRGVWRVLRGDRNILLIGTRIEVSGVDMPDDVLKASQIFPERGQSPFGTMFGTITGVKGQQLELCPRFTGDRLMVDVLPGCALMRQVTLPETAIKVGQRVTFWGEQRGPSDTFPLAPGEKSSDLKALALLLGPNRWPTAQGEGAPRYWTGQLIALDPTVQLRLANGQIVHVLPTAQMPIASLKTIGRQELSSGQPAMFLLSRRSNGRFAASSIIVDASPWTGYGQ